MSQTRKEVVAFSKQHTRSLYANGIWLDQDFEDFFEKLEADDSFKWHAVDDHDRLLLESFSIRIGDGEKFADKDVLEEINALREYEREEDPDLQFFDPAEALEELMNDGVDVVEFITHQINSGRVKSKILMRDLLLLRWFVWQLIRK